MTIYRGVGGVNRTVKQQFRGVSGVNREIKEQHRGVDGINRNVFSSNVDLIQIPYPSDLLFYLPMNDDSVIPKERINNEAITMVGTANIESGINGTQSKSRYLPKDTYFSYAKPYIPTTGAFSVRAFVRFSTSSSGTGGRIIYSTRYDDNLRYGFILSVTKNNEIFFALDYAYNSQIFPETTVAKNIVDNAWHEIIFSWDGTLNSGGVKLWVDGSLISSPKATSMYSVQHHNNGCTGNKMLNGASVYSTFNGYIAELAIFNTVKIPSSF
ncbi:LamG-like jellyroll fold domain-containing protein [Clostridium aminobutyricum]|uniref:LamG domain-containing protein n=1 Tax=Clostridium aminobutyricum TaxID=33953 RepID=A0A939IGD8_CLOAM|nr:LamG-like jellyroll fold domain-containing protein [Clostridium aminobutyricum]MBN7773155.1 hypothetical protein [Clostridium aminobutyricum]